MAVQKEIFQGPHGNRTIMMEVRKMSECVLYEHRGPVGYLTINRPKALNALNEEVLQSLENTIHLINNDKTIKVVILTGSGEKSFVAGADIAAMKDMTPVQAQDFSRLGQRVFRAIETARPVTIAAINGYALGGGCELAMACDIRIASEKAKMGIPEVTLGVFPSFAGTQRLPRLVGLGYAKEMLATAKKVPAEEALRIGLVNHVVPADQLMERCEALAAEICQHSTAAIAYGKMSMTAGLEMDMDRTLEHEATLFGLTFSTEDQREGMGAFLEKRPPKFQ